MAANQGQMENAPAERVKTTTKRYARTKETLELVASDDTRFIIDKIALTFMSSIFRTMFEDVGDNNEPVDMEYDDATAWRIVLDVFYSCDNTWKLAPPTSDDFAKALMLCHKYEMSTIRDWLTTFLISGQANCATAGQIISLLEEAASPLYGVCDRLHSWELVVGDTLSRDYWDCIKEPFKLGTPVAKLLKQYDSRTEEWLAKLERAKMDRLVNLMLQHEGRRCEIPPWHWGEDGILAMANSH